MITVCYLIRMDNLYQKITESVVIVLLDLLKNSLISWVSGGVTLEIMPKMSDESLEISIKINKK